MWVCPTCDYTLRTPAVSKLGILVMFLGLVLVGAYVIGLQNLGIPPGAIPTDLMNLMLANFPLLVVGTFGLGMLLMALGAFFVRAERNRVAAGA